MARPSASCAWLLAFALAAASSRLAIAVDSDLDGFADGADNCLFEPNDQADAGGLGSRSGDGHGDACQCGDANDDGAVLDDDVAALRASFADPTHAALSANGVAKCTVHGDRPVAVHDPRCGDPAARSGAVAARPGYHTSV